MVRSCIWMACDPTVSGEIAGAQEKPCLPTNGSPARKQAQPSLSVVALMDCVSVVAARDLRKVERRRNAKVAEA
jgi:hypothetical protein